MAAALTATAVSYTCFALVVVDVVDVLVVVVWLVVNVADSARDVVATEVLTSEKDKLVETLVVDVVGIAEVTGTVRVVVAFIPPVLEKVTVPNT